MSEPFLPPEPVQPLVPPLVLDLRMMTTNKMITIVAIRPPMIPNKTLCKETVAEKEIRKSLVKNINRYRTKQLSFRLFPCQKLYLRFKWSYSLFLCSPDADAFETFALD